MKIYRTPEARFSHLPDWPYAPCYHQITAELRLHYVDEGPKDAPVILMMHGEPTWGYLYRHMIGPMVAAGYRVVVPDLIGFGRSDKPVDHAVFTYAQHVAWMRHWLEALDLKNITLACQDWGSLIGLRLAAELPDRFAAIVLSNGGLPAGNVDARAFRIWRAFSRYSPLFPIARIIQAGTKRRFSPAEFAAYDAPFPTRASKAAARIFPSLVPVENTNPAVPDQLAAWTVFEAWNKPFLCAFSDGDPITRGGDAQFLERVPGTKGLAHRTLKGGHFIQEDDPKGFVDALLAVAPKAKAQAKSKAATKPKTAAKLATKPKAKPKA
ncbi:MAG: Haloalkane dehalogenase [Pseudomonadota bacterium]|jgi:haloalkane dehalogenase